MGAVARRVEVDGRELHESTGKLGPEGERHDPEWGDWLSDGPIWLRQCRHPDCDLDDYWTGDGRPENA